MRFCTDKKVLDFILPQLIGFQEFDHVIKCPLAIWDIWRTILWKQFIKNIDSPLNGFGNVVFPFLCFFLLSTCRFPFVGVIFFVSTQNLLNYRSQHFHLKSARSRNKKCRYGGTCRQTYKCRYQYHRVCVSWDTPNYETSNAMLHTIGMISVSALRSHWNSAIECRTCT